MIHSKKGVLVGKCSMITGGLVLGVVLVAGVLSGNVVSAEGDSTVDDVTITVPTSCTMSGVVDTAHTTSMQAATYSGTGGIGKTTLSTHCNDNNGFSIYAVGFTNDTDGTNTLVGTTSSQTINTGIYTSGATDSSWSMKVSKVTDSSQSYNPQNMTITNSFDNWHTVPTSYTKVAEYHAATGSSTTDTVLGAKVETTYDAYISRTQTADTYTGKVKYVMVHPYTEEPLQPQPSTAGCINYFANASDAVGTMGCQSKDYIDGNYYDIVDGGSVTLLASNFSRISYGFAGWSDSYDYATNPNAKFYGPQETITVPTGTTANGLSLYAVWIKSEGNLQDQSKVASVCNSLTTAPTDGTANLTSVSALTDQRDNNTYAIAKLADGKCWMIENLRLDNTAEHNSDGTLAQGYGGQFAGLANPEATWASKSTVANSLYSTDGADDTISIDTSYAGYRFPRYNHDNTNSRASNPAPTSNSKAMYSYGNYYTWAATIADTTHYASGDHDTTSICPTGWKIPLGNTSNGDIEQGASDPANKVPGFSYLDRKMGGTGAYQSTAGTSLRWYKYPVNTVYSGSVNGGSVNYRGSLSNYWSSAVNSSYYAYILYLNSSNVGPGVSSVHKYLGVTVRCVASSS